MDYVARLHKNLGHPPAATLLRMMEEVQATDDSDDVIKAARGYVRKHCYIQAISGSSSSRNQFKERQQPSGGRLSLDSRNVSEQ